MCSLHYGQPVTPSQPRHDDQREEEHAADPRGGREDVEPHGEQIQGVHLGFGPLFVLARTYVQRHVDEIMHQLKPELLMVCGLSPMLDEVERLALDFGLPRDAIRTEAYDR